jgi:CheY-like chemotaxis protein
MKKIVIVEDQQVIANVYRSKFAAEGFQVEIAFDGERGLELINEMQPDAVLLDWRLPKLSGRQILDQLRKTPKFQSLPVIVFSESSLPPMVHEAWTAGATMVLSKSMHSPNQVIEAVKHGLLKAWAKEVLREDPDRR